MATEAEGLLAVTGIAAIALLFRRDRVSAQPIARMNIARPKAAVVTGLALPRAVTTLAATGIVAGDVAVAKQPIVAVLEGRCSRTGREGLTAKPRAHLAAISLVADRAVGASVAIESSPTGVAANTARLLRQSLRTQGIRQACHSTVTLWTTDVAASVTSVRIS